MNSDAIRAVRRRYDFNQTDLAHVLGVHMISVSKWEREISEPSYFHIMLMDAMWKHSPRKEFKYKSVSLLHFWHEIFHFKIS